MNLCVELIEEPSVMVAGSGVDEIGMTNPTRSGDALHLRMNIASKRESKNNPKIGLVSIRVALLNQRDEVVLSYLNAGMVLKKRLTNHFFRRYR